jgi:hypothetical protein
MLNSHNKTILQILGRNPIHPFPARMAPGIALEALGNGARPLRVLDPMVGSGTVIAVARANGHRALGVDLDPLAVLIAGVWTRTLDPEQIRNKAAEVLGRAKERALRLRAAQTYPSGSDEESRSFIRYWFDEYARTQLTALSSAISRIRDDSCRNVLWCAFSRLIITKQAGASLAMDLSHSRPHRRFTRAPIKPFNKFISAVETIVANCPQAGGRSTGPNPIVKRGDARNLHIESGSIDLVLTSPPYLNAIDYMRCSKFSLVWMGYNVSDLREIRRMSVGAETSYACASDAEWVKSVIRELNLRPKLSSRNLGLLARYVWDMGDALSECSRVLRRGGRAVYVVGDSMTKGTFIRNSVVITAVAQQHGLSLVLRQSRALPASRRYLPPPKRGRCNANMDGRMRKEILLVFKKA